MIEDLINRIAQNKINFNIGCQTILNDENFDSKITFTHLRNCIFNSIPNKKDYNSVVRTNGTIFNNILPIITKLYPDITYSPSKITEGFDADPVSGITLTDFVDFFNLVGDLGYQDKKFETLLGQCETDELKNIWEYYCNNHLFKAKKQKDLAFDKQNFTVDFKKLVEMFEGLLMND